MSEFLCYRAALGNEDEAKVLNHFSRLYLSEWLGSVLFVDEFAVDHNLAAVRGSVSVADEINYVHDYRVSRTEDQRYSLTIIYSPVLGGSVRRLRSR